MERLSEKKDITLEDVELAIKILTIFTKRYYESIKILQKVSRIVDSGRSMPVSFDSIMKMAFETVSKNREEYDEPLTITNEELQKFREITKKIEEKEKQT